MFVSGWQQALTVLLAVVPGFVFQSVRSMMRGPSPEDKDLGVRVIRALAISGAIGLLYLGALGPTLVSFLRSPLDDISRTEYAVASAIAVLLLFAAPACLALLAHAVTAGRAFPELNFWDRFSVYDPTPTAWDFGTRRLEPGSVRIMTNDGKWIGGVAASGSFFTSYPENREIYLEQAWSLGDDGTFLEPVVGSVGMWVNCNDALLVQFLSPDSEAQDGTVAADDFDRSPNG